MTGAVLLDVDGTLVDSNYMQVDAWVHAFRDVGIEIDAWRVHRTLGMAGPQLVTRVAELSGAELSDETAEQVKEHHSRHAAESAHLLRAFDGARELVRTISERGARPVLATSASPEMLERLREVLDVDDLLHAVTSAQDVEESKPEPELVQVALEAAGVEASQAVFLGDSVWDAVAAERAGVPCVGVLSGGVGAHELTEAGAVETYTDVAELLADLDGSALAAVFSG
ncbi:HAD family hydrolase [Isoptericola halotolerans]|uniref:HAD superfamily hydrolase (TIGR01509 family) n=1 Tax=Isoptericola halotolerans TaxID=300560 RepID=A0ABX2A1P9_9MICO|nr:HAD family hydrolase [Isoptericola halotolerans]NOV95518.1 HAD superfamily hydrolase (TIGR01509 family) [Isoptericola halotolerans]